LYNLVLKTIKELLLFIMIIALPAHAGLFDSSDKTDPRPVHEAFDLKTESIAGNKLLLRWDILEDYYLYDHRLKFSTKDAVTLSEISRSTTKLKEDPLFGQVAVYYHSAEVMLQFSNIQALKKVALNIEYQGCWEGGVCYPPVSEIRTIDLMATAENSKATTSQTLAPTSKVQIQGSASQQDYFSKLLLDGDLLWILVAFFVAGLALCLTPCVFPMIPILSSIIAGQGPNITKYKAFILTLVYVLSVAVTYTLAGVLAGLFGENLQILFQQTWIIILFSIVFVLLALSMFGFYDLQLPASVQTKLSKISNSQEGGSYFGVAIMGILSALIVGPCMAAPLAGALIYIGQTADPLLGGLALFSLSIGMGVPLLLVGMSAGHLMPKAGAWMSSVKAGFGVLLILMAIYMLDRIVSLQVTMLLTAITLITSSIYMGAITRQNKERSNLAKMSQAMGLIILVYGLSLLLGTFVGNANFIQPLKGLSSKEGYEKSSLLTFQKITSIAQLEPILKEAKLKQRPVMLDFSADWCISCVEMEFMFEEEQVAKHLVNIDLVKVDLTNFNDDSSALLEKYHVLGPPALVFFDRAGELQQQMNILGVVDADSFVEHIQPLISQ